MDETVLDAKPNGEGLPAQRYRSRPEIIGAILVRAGRLTEVEAEQIHETAVRDNALFGVTGVRLKRLTPDDVEYALSRQLEFPRLAVATSTSISKDVVAAHDADASACEDLRTIRTRLMTGWMVKTDRAVLAITSPERGEGRSWLAANLAMVFAQCGKRTLLIDADLRHSSQHRLFNLDNNVGLTALLSSRGSRQIVQRIHPDLRLFVMPAGPAVLNPQDLLSRRVLDMALERFSRKFDLIVLDTPAAVDTADAEILATCAGAALLVSRKHHTRHSALLTAMDSLKRSNVRIIGTVMNDH